jgi:rRNA maturation RNase YbeY
MAVSFFAEDVKMPALKTRLTKQWIVKIFDSYKKQMGELSFIFCSDNYLLEINNKYLNHNYFTDIVTFNYCEGDVISGDIFISTDRVSENAKIYNSEQTELFRVMAHGLLHLFGYNDATDSERQEMRKQEDLCLSFIDW